MDKEQVSTMTEETLSVFGEEYKIKLMDDSDYRKINDQFPNSIGIHRSYEKEIHINMDDKWNKTDRYLQETLWHEVGHAILNSIGLYSVGFNKEHEELIVEAYAKFLAKGGYEVKNTRLN